VAYWLVDGIVLLLLLLFVGYYPHMLIGTLEIYQLLLSVSLFLCLSVCNIKTVTAKSMPRPRRLPLQ